jgi:hypothetical protein
LLVPDKKCIQGSLFTVNLACSRSVLLRVRRESAEHKINNLCAKRLCMQHMAAMYEVTSFSGTCLCKRKCNAHGECGPRALIFLVHAHAAAWTIACAMNASSHRRSSVLRHVCVKWRRKRAVQQFKSAFNFTSMIVM